MNKKELEKQLEEKIKTQIKQKLENRIENKLDSLIEFSEQLVVDMSNLLASINNFAYLLVLKRKITQMEKNKNE